jgi:hypothetical protein
MVSDPTKPIPGDIEPDGDDLPTPPDQGDLPAPVPGDDDVPPGMMRRQQSKAVGDARLRDSL